jgi:CMP-N-acetylneuraminic acid synthetase
LTLDPSEVTVIIPARVGSQRIPRKNFLPLHPDGSNAVQLAVQAALYAGFRHIVVSSDIAPAERNMILPVLWDVRPDYLATAEATTLDVVQYLTRVACYRNRAYLLLQPTQPLRRVCHLQQVLRLLTDTVDSVVTIGLDRFVRDGTAYLFWDDTLRRAGTIYGHQVALMPIPAAETCPLDTPEDWTEAVRRLRESPYHNPKHLRQP